MVLDTKFRLGSTYEPFWLCEAGFVVTRGRRRAMIVLIDGELLLATWPVGGQLCCYKTPDEDDMAVSVYR